MRPRSRNYMQKGTMILEPLEQREAIDRCGKHNL